MTAMEGIKGMIAAKRTELAEVLGKLPAERWDDPTLCAGWRVREVVAHIIMPFRYSSRQFVFELARSRGKFNAMADRCARRDAAVMSPDELVTALRSNACHPWKPPRGGYQGALTHDVIHGMDITEAPGPRPARAGRPASRRPAEPGRAKIPRLLRRRSRRDRTAGFRHRLDLRLRDSGDRDRSGARLVPLRPQAPARSPGRSPRQLSAARIDRGALAPARAHDHYGITAPGGRRRGRR